jgi:hypothetical protein
MSQRVGIPYNIGSPLPLATQVDICHVNVPGYYVAQVPVINSALVMTKHRSSIYIQ